MAFKTSEEYKSVIYSGDCRHKLKLLFNGVELADADVYCESLKVTSRILPNGSTRFSLDNFVAKEAEIILHDINTTIIQSPVNISIGTLVDGTYEYVPIGLFVVQDLPTTDKNKTTIKLRDYAVKFDFGYNAKDIIDENGGSATKLQILQDICSKAGVETDITKFYGSNSKIGIYDNTITGRTYVGYLAEQAGAIATIDRSGKLIFVQLKDLETVEIPLNIVEKYEDGEKYEISRVVYEDAIRKFEYGDESKDTLFINTANPYIDNEVLTNTLTGAQIETSDSSDNEVTNYKQYGITKQNVYSGKQLFDANDTYQLNYGTKDSDDWITLYMDNTEGTETRYSNWMTSPSEQLKPNTQYAVIVEVKEVTGNAYINICGTQTNALAQFEGYTLQFATTTPGIYKKILSTIADFENTVSMLRTFATFRAGTSGSITFRLSVIEDTTITTDNFKYEPYVGGKVSPSPDYPQEIEVGRGKNLLNIGTVSFTRGINYNDLKIPAGTYTFSAKITSNDTDGDKSRVYFYSNGTNVGFINLNRNTRSSATITLTSDVDQISLYASYDNAHSTDDTATYEDIQLEKGSLATSYLPYNTIENKSTGKNLLKPNGNSSTAVGLTFTNNEDGTFTIKGTATSNRSFPLTKILPTLKKNKNYTLSLTILENTGDTFTVPVTILNEDGTPQYNYFTLRPDKLSQTNLTDREITTSAISLYIANGKTPNVTFKVQLEENDVATEWEEYKESSITYNLGDNFLADKDYIENGVLNKNVGKVVLNGSENWTLYSNASEGISFMLNLPTSSNVSIGFHTSRCNKYVNISQAWNSTHKNDYGIYSDHANYKYKYFRPPNADITTVDQWKAWLSENNIEMYYELATPEQIPLETTGELRTFESNTIITNDLDSNMEIEYARNQTQVSQILELNKNISLNSFKTGKIIGNPAIDAYDIIKIIDGDKEFKTLATNDLTYNGVMKNTFDTQIGKEAKKENVTLTPEATFKKWAKTEIDNVEAEVRITTGKIEEHVVELQKDVDNNSVNINNNYQEVIKKFGDYTPISKTVQIENSVTQLQTDTYTKTEINTKLTDGSVTKVMTTSGTFDEDGMHYEKTGAPTKSTINEKGVNVDSSTTGDELLFAGYDEELKQTIVRTENLTVRRYLVIGKNSRIEDYTDENGNEGGGIFTL